MNSVAERILAEAPPAADQARIAERLMPLVFPIWRVFTEKKVRTVLTPFFPKRGEKLTMPYTEQSLLDDIKKLMDKPTFPEHFKGWVWEEEKGFLRNHHAFGRGIRAFGGGTEEQWSHFTLHLYCWAIYSKTNTDGGRQIIGREWDTDPYSLTIANIGGRATHTGYIRNGKTWTHNRGRWIATQKWKQQDPKASIQGDKGLNYDEGARGNVLKSDKWHPIMNDCWVLGKKK